MVLNYSNNIEAKNVLYYVYIYTHILKDVLCVTLNTCCKYVTFNRVEFTVDTIQYNTVQYSTVQYSTVQYSTVQYSTVQYSTIQYNTIQYNTIQYNTIQYNTIQYNGCNQYSWMSSIDTVSVATLFAMFSFLSRVFLVWIMFNTTGFWTNV